MKIYRTSWWKWLGVALLLYTVARGLTMEVPRLAILNESIRNLFFHVPMWFGMVLLLLLSMVYSIRFLRGGNLVNDAYAEGFAHVGILFGLLGCATGAWWARFTWGAWWVNDPKLNGAAIGTFIYLAYVVLRGSMPDNPSQRGRIAAVYNIFAFAALIPLLFILPRLNSVDSLHPGNGGNPGFNAYDLDSRLRSVFYPAVFGWFLMGMWLASLKARVRVLQKGL